ncbi:hypothetical protein L9F63_022131, partial [Diploptera punctata]
DLFVDLLEEEKENKQVMINKIEGYLKEAAELNEELHVNINYDGYENLPLKEMEHTLKHKLESYRKIKEERVAQFHVLRAREVKLSEQLGIALREFKCQVLSEEQMMEYGRYLAEKENERDMRFSQFQDIKSGLLQMNINLEFVPNLVFEKMVLYEEDSKFVLTEQNMILLREMQQKWERREEEAKAEALDIRMKITELWDRLHEDYAHREAFLASVKGYSISVIKTLRKELERCEELKRRNMKLFVGEIRKELDDWWKRCMITDEQKQSFLPYFSDCYTEDLLELHELEVNKYKNFYHDNIDIFQLAQERQELWDKMLELQQKASDPERLFRNRGGQLLMEEKERTRIQKELPKVEKKLSKYVAAYEEKNGEPIKFNGEPVSAIIEKQWNDFNNRKENLKMVKKMERTRLLAVEAKLGSQIPSSSKRKVENSPARSHGPNKKQKMTAERQGNINRRLFPRNNLRARARPEPDASIVTTYTDFEDHLEAKDQDGIYRSSVLPGRCLRERNTPAKSTPNITSKLKTPQMHTPAKPPRKNLTPSNILKTPCSVPKNIRSAQKILYHKSPVTAPRLTAAKTRLPIII